MRQRRRRNISQESPKGIGSQLLGLSMFVMLLAFFMVLNSLSTYETEKIETIKQSIEDTFASKVYQYQNAKPSMSASAERRLGEGDTLDRIEGLFKAEIPGYSIVKSKQRGMILIEVPRDTFEGAINTFDQKSGTGNFSKAFLPALVALVRAEERGKPYRMDITYHTQDNPAHVQNQSPKLMAATVRDVAAIAGKIERAGLPARLMTIGLEKGRPETVALIFQTHRPFQPPQPQQGEGGVDDNRTPAP